MIWPIVIGNHLQITPSLYEMLKNNLSEIKRNLNCKDIMKY